MNQRPDVRLLLDEMFSPAIAAELRELGALDFDELVADATFVRAKKGVTTSETPRLARV